MFLMAVLLMRWVMCNLNAAYSCIAMIAIGTLMFLFHSFCDCGHVPPCPGKLMLSHFNDSYLVRFIKVSFFS